MSRHHVTRSNHVTSMPRFASRLPVPTPAVTTPKPYTPRSLSPPLAPPSPTPHKMEVLDSSWYVSCLDHIGLNPDETYELFNGGHFDADEFGGGTTSRRNTWTVEDNQLELDLIADQSMPVVSADNSSADEEASADEVTCDVTLSPPATNRVERSGTFRTFRPEGARPPGPDIAQGEDEEGAVTTPALGNGAATSSYASGDSPPNSPTVTLQSDVLKSPPPESVTTHPRSLPPPDLPIVSTPNFVAKKSKHAAMMERLAASIAKDRNKPKKEVKSKLNQSASIEPCSGQSSTLGGDKGPGKITFLKKLSSFDATSRFAFVKKTTQNHPSSSVPIQNGDLNISRRESFASSLTSSSVSESKPKPRRNHVTQPAQAQRNGTPMQHKAYLVKASKDTALNHTITNGKIATATNLRNFKPQSNGTLTRTIDYQNAQSKTKKIIDARARAIKPKPSGDNCPKTLLLRRQFNGVVLGIQALAIVVDRQIERERINSIWHRQEVEKVQSQAQVDIDEAQRRNMEYMANQMAMFETKLECLEKVKARERIELQNRMNQEREKLGLDHELALKSVQDDCQRTLLEKETAYQVDISLLKAENLRLSEECVSLKEKNQRTEMALTRSAEKKLELARATYQTQRAEIESLTAVLEMKNAEIHKLRADNVTLERKCEELNEKREELERLRMKTEELTAIIDNKAHCEQVLSEEKVQLRRAYEKESKVNQRLSLELEELAWKLKQNKTTKRSSTSSIPPSTTPNTSMSRSVESSPFNKHSTPYKIPRGNNGENITSQSLILNDSAADLDESECPYFPIVHMYVGKQSYNDKVPMRQKYNDDNCHQSINSPGPVPFDPGSLDNYSQLPPSSEEISTLTDL